jgi:hypothetical protein
MQSNAIAVNFAPYATLFSRLNLDDLVPHHHVLQRRPFAAGIEGHFDNIQGRVGFWYPLHGFYRCVGLYFTWIPFYPQGNERAK